MPSKQTGQHLAVGGECPGLHSRTDDYSDRTQCSTMPARCKQCFITVLSLFAETACLLTGFGKHRLLVNFTIKR